MRTDDLSLPDDMDLLKAMVRGMAEKTSVRGQDPAARAAARQAISKPIVAELFTLWQQTLPRISGKSKLAEAIRYAITRREIFERFLTDGLMARSTPTSSSAPSGPRPSPARTASSPDRTAVAAHGPPSPRSCRPAK